MTQQVFLKLFSAVKQFRSNAEFTTWLYRLVANACVDEHRRRRRFVPFGDALQSSESQQKHSQEERYAQIEISNSVKEAVASLKPKYRIAILLKYFEGLSYEEMATVLGCSKGTVASRLNRGHKTLARKLNHLRETSVHEG